MDDKQIVELFWERSEDAIAETDRKYGRYILFIAKNVLSDDEDAREVQNDTYRARGTVFRPSDRRN